jgi:hypothetical protein
MHAVVLCAHQCAISVYVLISHTHKIKRCISVLYVYVSMMVCDNTDKDQVSSDYLSGCATVSRTVHTATVILGDLQYEVFDGWRCMIRPPDSTRCMADQVSHFDATCCRATTSGRRATTPLAS